MLQFSSAYKQLSDYERDFVDGFLRRVDTEAERRFEKLTITLERVASSLDLNTLDERSRDLFRKPIVSAAIRERAEQIAAERDLTPQRIIQEHAAIGLFNLQRFFPDTGEDGVPRFDASNCNAVDWAAIQQIDIEETYGRNGTTRKIKIKAHAKQQSLDAIAKFMGIDKADNAEYAAYKTLPAEMAQLPNSAGVAELAEKYARFIDG